MKPEWYSPGEVSSAFRKHHIIWLLNNVIDADNWPADPAETGYSGNQHNRNNNHAHYESMKMVTAELTYRLDQTGADGLALEFVTRLSAGDDDRLIQRIAKYQRRSFWEVAQGIKTALGYCSGSKRRKMSYLRFCSLRRDSAQEKQGRGD